MAKTINPEAVMAELKLIKKDLAFIKKHVIDMDTILTPEERARLEESLKEHKEGKAVSLEQFEKEMRKQHA